MIYSINQYQAANEDEQSAVAAVGPWPHGRYAIQLPADDHGVAQAKMLSCFLGRGKTEQNIITEWEV